MNRINIKLTLMMLAAYVGASFFSYAAESGSEIEKEMCAKLPEVIKKGNQSYKAGEYAKARDYFTEQVSLSEGCGYFYGKPDQTATITAYNNVALSYIKEGDKLKALAWLSLAPNDKKSKFNYGLLKSMPAPVGPDMVGTYWQYAGFGSWNVASVEKQGNGYLISLNLLYFGLMGLAYGPNIGDISQVVTMKDDKGLIKLTGEEGNCEISIKFIDKDNGMLKLDTNPERKECGFGHNVYAYGDFIRVSGKPTPFDIGY
ncbi:tetratricopeptide repeat protein [Aeromonas caviae]|uniref:tetratricopeptide repeat protein n=1 Tax=Aeromonas caviae TaxID=648 RepID=UPI001BCEF8A8|nr:tetratricopeptide repeat protein [Aeromonas caviae]MBS4714096.1 tetratricopeptide repeat protein [Aeromonas caviae]